MSSFIEELKKEHKAVLEIFSQLHRLGITSDAVFEKLLRTKDMLLRHLKKEDDLLYPKLQAAAEDDHKLKSKLEFFAEDTTIVTNYAFQFYNDLANGTSVSNLAKELGELTAILKMRILKEENILFPEYEKIASAEPSNQSSSKA